MRVAIVKLSALGDVIHLGVFLPWLKEKIPNICIEWFADEVFAGILQNTPTIDRVHALPLKQAWKSRDFRLFCDTLNALRSEELFDCVIDAQGLVKSAIIARLLPARERVGFDWPSAKESLASLFYTRKVSMAYHTHILRRNVALLSQALGIPFDAENLPISQNVFGATLDAKERVDHLLEGLDRGKKRVLLVLEASKNNKIYPKESFLELSFLLKEVNVLLLWYNDYQSAAFIHKNNSATCLLPRLTLDEIKALMRSMDIVIGGDTGVTHLAWAMGRASVTLFGNTPLERFAMPGEKNLSLRSPNGVDYDTKDFSIAKIDPHLIYQTVARLS